MRRRARWALLLPVVLLGLAHADRDADSVSNWRLASRAPVGLAPDPADTPEAVVQVYAARAARWRGYFGVHTWIAAKPTNAPAFTVYEVTGFRVRRGGPAVRISERSPDGRWFGSAPDLLADMRGAGVDAIIGRIEQAIATYPYENSYRIWPGPNSNTFTAFVLRQVPELRSISRRTPSARTTWAHACSRGRRAARGHRRASSAYRVARCRRGRARGERSWPDVRPGSERSGAEAAARRQHRVRRLGHASLAMTFGYSGFQSVDD